MAQTLLRLQTLPLLLPEIQLPEIRLDGIDDSQATELALIIWEDSLVVEDIEELLAGLANFSNLKNILLRSIIWLI